MIVKDSYNINRQGVLVLQDMINKRVTNKLITKINTYQNNVIDEAILNYHDDYTEEDIIHSENNNRVFDNKTDAAILLALVNMNRERVYKTYIPIVNDNRTSNGNLLKIKTRDLAEKQTKRIAEELKKNILNNKEYLLKQIHEGEFNLEKYKTFIKNYRNVSRLELTNRSLKEGLTPMKNFSFTKLENKIGAMYRQASRETEFEKVKSVNEERIGNNLEPKFTYKKWVWSQLEKTRHSSMDNVIVLIDEFFEVVNDINGDTDYLLYPLDYMNDSNNCSNICNCQCDVEYLTEPS